VGEIVGEMSFNRKEGREGNTVFWKNTKVFFQTVRNGLKAQTEKNTAF
jgi:hypothetical protein